MEKQVLYFISSAILAVGWFAIGYLVPFFSFSVDNIQQNPLYIFSIPHEIALYLLLQNIQEAYLIAYLITVIIIYLLLNIIFTIVPLLKDKLFSKKPQTSDVKTINTALSTQPYLKPDVQIKDSSGNKGLYRLVAISGIITLIVSGLVFILAVVYLVFFAVAANLAILEYPELKTIQNDPTVTIRMPNATELHHYRSEREGSGIGGAVGPDISYTFGTSQSEDEVSRFYQEKLANLGWTIEDYAYRKTYATRWCKQGLHFNIFFFDSYDRKQATFKPEWKNYPTVFRATLFAGVKNSSCPK